MTSGVTSKPITTRLFCALTIGIFTLVPAAAASAVNRDRSADRGADWLLDRQQTNGAFFSESQDVDATAATLGAVVAGGVRGDSIRRALGYIEDHAQARATRGELTGRIVAGIVAGGADPRSFGGVDYVQILSSQYNAATGAYDSNFLSNLVAANGALAAGETLPDQAVAYVRSNACPSGGFGSEDGCASGATVDASAWAINVLVAAGQASDPVVASARSFLSSVQTDDGGFASTSGGPTTSDATGLAISAIQALAEDPKETPWNQTDDDDPVEALKSLQNRSGGFRPNASQSEPSGVSTVNAVPGMAGSSYPIHAASGEDSNPEPDPGVVARSSRSDRDEDADHNGDDAAPGENRQVAVQEQGNRPGGTGVRYLEGPGPDREKPITDRSADQSFARPKPYVDPSGRIRLLAWAGLSVSGAMIMLGIRLLRYGHV